MVSSLYLDSTVVFLQEKIKYNTVETVIQNKIKKKKNLWPVQGLNLFNAF